MTKSKIYFNPDGVGAEVFLGPLEAKIMEILWEKNYLSVKQVHFSFAETERPAYTTVMTIMNRLADKEVLTKTKKGRQYLYSPILDKKKFISNKLNTINKSLKQFKK